MDIPGVGELIGKLGGVLANEASLICGVPGKVKDFKAEFLEYMQLCLKDADRSEMQTQSSEGVEMKWLTDIRDKAYEAEDIIDEFFYHMNKRNAKEVKENAGFGCLNDVARKLQNCHTGTWLIATLKFDNPSFYSLPPRASATLLPPHPSDSHPSHRCSSSPAVIPVAAAHDGALSSIRQGCDNPSPARPSRDKPRFGR